jgi:sporadic carbohydrate cluster 2OG-Fe(II) oxygenase
MNFLSDEELILSEDYLKNGYVIRKSPAYESIEYLRNRIVTVAADLLNEKYPEDPDIFLNTIHRKVTSNDLNNFRLGVIQGINKDPDFRKHYFLSAKPLLESLVGNELSMQLRVNLSIQFPEDDSSLLPVHSDTWSGDSPYEVVVWIPMVDCYKTKAMYLLLAEDSKKLLQNFHTRAGKNSEELYQSIKDEVKFLNINYGEVMVFDQGYPHGNRINQENETRWSMNCRFKGVFTPYGDKKIGEFFEPISLRAASRIGMNYKFPEV